MDSKVLDDLTVADFNADTVRAYRTRFRAARQGSSWTDLDDERFLRAVGAAMVSREDGKLHPTFGGLLMFGNDYDIVRECPHYFLDYQETLDPAIRWTDRVHSGDGMWSGNLFDFFFRVNRKLAESLKTPSNLTVSFVLTTLPCIRRFARRWPTACSTPIIMACVEWWSDAHPINWFSRILVISERALSKCALAEYLIRATD